MIGSSCCIRLCAMHLTFTTHAATVDSAVSHKISFMNCAWRTSYTRVSMHTAHQPANHGSTRQHELIAFLLHLFTIAVFHARLNSVECAHETGRQTHAYIVITNHCINHRRTTLADDQHITVHTLILVTTPHSANTCRHGILVNGKTTSYCCLNITLLIPLPLTLCFSALCSTLSTYSFTVHSATFCASTTFF